MWRNRRLLVSDALACWFLVEAEKGEHPWEVLTGLTPEVFPVWVEHLRSERVLRNDDVTLLQVDVGTMNADS